MPDANEIRALKASFLGALESGRAIEAIKSTVMDIDPDAEVADDVLEELGRITLAHGVSAQALRGLVEAMRARRGVG